MREVNIVLINQDKNDKEREAKIQIIQEDNSNLDYVPCTAIVGGGGGLSSKIVHWMPPTSDIFQKLPNFVQLYLHNYACHCSNCHSM